MLEIEINGKKAQAPEGSTVIEAAQLAGVYIPNFCYHKKLSIAASCRMCLVEVEKAPKPLPACATPVTNGMKVFTHSGLAVKAQKGVMEFLLINHPLDCPVCDQAGECQLQDLAAGYGETKSRFAEKKHVVAGKDVGPLISMREMSRCIHCTRCVRFGREIAGVMELGMTHRSIHSEITTFLGRAIESELSGNLIDVCPVGALTSQPFRYMARAWELSGSRSISPHDSVGANITVQTKAGKVMRVLPRENEAVNECWLTDKDRFSYTALHTEERLTKPMLKQDGEWLEVSWQEALDYVAHGLKDIAADAGSDALAALAAPWATVEELHLLKKLMRELGTDNVDYRLRRQDFSLDGKRAGASWLGMKIEDVRHLDSVLVVGSFLRKDHPLLTQRLRHAVQKHHAEINLISVTDEDPKLDLHTRQTVSPANLVFALAAVVKEVAEIKGVAMPELASVPGSEAAKRIAASLLNVQHKAILFGHVAEQVGTAGLLHQLGLKLAELTGASFGFLGEAANSVGGQLLGLGKKAEANARQMFVKPRQAYLLFGFEPELDCANPTEALTALKEAKMTALFTSFKHAPALEYADVLLPLAAFTETSGTFVNIEGRTQSFTGAVSPAGEARPGWKILRVLANVLDVSGFDFESSEEVLREAWREAGVSVDAEGFVSGLDNGLADAPALSLPAPGGLWYGALERIADVPIYFTDPTVRRAAPLQKTSAADQPSVRVSGATLAKLGLSQGDVVVIRQTQIKGTGGAKLKVTLDEGVPEDCLRVAAGHPLTSALGGMFDPVFVENG
ncbi:MAG: NADH-quinone oxidoreductase subunit NuoG [Zoogloeaceae bacterium]|jgi:NADH-quinone oxidoreductase subunit G|nr:NADH-quinone oxidoreductase subunit NuoG [Zoogloeaceae bacterium]